MHLSVFTLLAPVIENDEIDDELDASVVLAASVRLVGVSRLGRREASRD
jgi:hypothetical protein